jgi:hypothetical protein
MSEQFHFAPQKHFLDGRDFTPEPVTLDAEPGRTKAPAAPTASDAPFRFAPARKAEPGYWDGGGEIGIEPFQFAPGLVKEESDPSGFFETAKAPELYPGRAFMQFMKTYDPDDEDEPGTFRKSRQEFVAGMSVVVLGDKRRRKMRLSKVIPMPHNFFLCDGDWTDESGSVRGIFSGAELAIAA